MQRSRELLLKTNDENHSSPRAAYRPVRCGCRDNSSAVASIASPFRITVLSPALSLKCFLARYKSGLYGCLY